MVLNFAKSEEAFVGYSFVVGEVWQDDVVWGAHGTSAEAGTCNRTPARAFAAGCAGLRGLSV